ncbi:MAG: thioredoxin family protein [Sphingobacteriales bacterium JAD_PAG50586_3]|nr:MAG: thioredoxin family protein [Sphingobacteriales bacterium JAD_PAG50586_3]
MKKLSLLLVIVFAALGASAQGYKPGDKAMNIKLKNQRGGTTSFDDFKNAKGFIVVFTCNHCPFAVKYEDRINDLAKKYDKESYPVIAVNPNDSVAYPDDSYSKMQVRAKDKGFVFPYLLDDTQVVAKTYGATKTPHVYLLQKEGSDYVVKYVGAIDDNTDNPSAVKVKYVEQAIDELNAGKPVSVPTTKAIGCGIKWKKA